GELCSVLVEPPCIARLQRARYLLVQTQSTRRNQLLVECLTEERVREPVANRAESRMLVENASAHCSLQRRRQLFLVHACYVLQHGQVELAADDRRDSEQPIALRAQTRQSFPDHIAQPLWNAALRRSVVGANVAIALADDHTCFHQVAQE